MFWNSVFGGLGVLTHWQTYIAGLEFFLISFIPVLVLMKAESKAGCLVFLLQPAIGVVGSVVLIWTLLPIILGLSREAAWSLPWHTLGSDPWYWSKVVFVILLLEIGLSFIPIVGNLNSVHTMLSGSIILVVAIALLGHEAPQMFPENFSAYPGFWFLVGLVVVGAIFSLIALIAASIASGLPGVVLILPIFGSALGFLPVFMYGSYLGAQLIKN